MFFCLTYLYNFTNSFSSNVSRAAANFHHNKCLSKAYLSVIPEVLQAHRLSYGNCAFYPGIGR
jgi:hypothetical protein